MEAPLLGGEENSREVVVSEDTGKTWIRYNGRWYPAAARSIQDKQLTALAVLVPCLAVALKYGVKTRKFLVTLVLTTLLYFPGLFYALFLLLIEPRRPSMEQLADAPLGYVYGTDMPVYDDLNYASLD